MIKKIWSRLLNKLNWIFFQAPIMGGEASEITQVKWTLATLWLVWFGIFTAYNSLEVLQSSLNPKIGLISISFLYASTVFTNLVAPVIILKLTPKWTIVGSCICHTFFIGANYYPRWFTLIPAGILVGMATGPFWTCFKLYITIAAVRYSILTGNSKTAMLSKFNGLVSTTLPLSAMFGSLVSSLILKYVKFDSLNDLEDVTKIKTTPSFNNNYTHTINDSFSINCGPDYCPEGLSSKKDVHSNHSGQPQFFTLVVLVSVLGCFNLCSVFLAMFGLRNLSPEDIKGQLPEMTEKTNRITFLRKYLKEYFDWRFFLLVPGAAYLHLLHSLFSGMFPKAYISCSIGIGMIGYVIIIHGFATLVTKFVSGILGQYVHINILFGFSFVLVIIMVVMLLLWEYLPSQMVGFFAISALSGVAGGNNFIQFNVLIADYFTDKKMEVFSFIHFFSGIITALGFLSVNYICVQTQLYIYLGIMVAALVSYVLFIVYVEKTDYSIISEVTENTDKGDEELKSMEQYSADEESSDLED